MQVEENLSVEKYLKAIAVMTNSVGKLDVLKLHLQGMYGDKMAVAILESVIKELSNAVGMDYNMISIDLPKIKPLDAETREIINEKNMNIGYGNVTPEIEPITCEIVTGKENNMSYSGNGFAKYMDMANKTLSEKFAKKSVKKVMPKTETKIINQSKGIEIDEKTGRMTYQFVNSSHLAVMTYDRFTKELTMTFKTGRTYLYQNIPMFLFDNVSKIDESGTASAGGYFNQNVVKKPKQYPYQEITDTEFIG